MNGYQNNYPFYYPNYKPPVDERIWVQNETSAEAYLVAPNSFVRLWDTNKPIFYEKRADATGRPTMERFSYAKIEAIEEDKEDKSTIDYQNEIDAVIRRIEALEKERENAKQSNATNKRIPDV